MNLFNWKKKKITQNGAANSKNRYQSSKAYKNIYALKAYMNDRDAATSMFPYTHLLFELSTAYYFHITAYSSLIE